MKSKGIAYILWILGGLLGFHKFYLEKIGMGLLYLFTAGILGIGTLIDLFTLGNQVDIYNLKIKQGESISGNEKFKIQKIQDNTRDFAFFAGLSGLVIVIVLLFIIF